MSTRPNRHGYLQRTNSIGNGNHCTSLRLLKKGKKMLHRQSFKTGLHLKAARTLAGLKQSELASLAGLHVNSLKRLERMRYLYGSDYAVTRIGQALRAKGIIAQTWPMPMVRLADEMEFKT